MIELFEMGNFRNKFYRNWTGCLKEKVERNVDIGDGEYVVPLNSVTPVDGIMYRLPLF